MSLLKVIMYLYGNFDYKNFDYKTVIEPEELTKILLVNTNLMIRTACLLTVNNIIAAAGEANRGAGYVRYMEADRVLMRASATGGGFALKIK